MALEQKIGTTLVALMIVGGAWLWLNPPAAPAADSAPVLARIVTSAGDRVTGRLVPMASCPSGYICADPLDYAR